MMNSEQFMDASEQGDLEADDLSLKGSRPTPPPCAYHPETPASCCCTECKSFICSTCAITLGGENYCPNCFAKAKPPATRINQNRFGAGTKVRIRPRASRPPEMQQIDQNCHYHSEVRGKRHCQVCRTPICGVCEFELPCNLFVCPTCASAPGDNVMTAGRITWAVLSGVAVLIYPIAFVAIGALGEMIGGIIVMITVLGGAFCAFAGLERNLKNPWYLWLSVSLHSLMVLVLMITIMIGILTQ